MSKSILVVMTAVAVFTAGLQAAAVAGQDTTKAAPATPEVDLFHTGALELQTLTGVLFSQQPTHDARPNFDYELTAVRIGYMLDTPRGHGFFRGNDEVLLEGQGSVLFQGPGTAMGGASILYRRNFIQPGSLVIPYFNAGMGGLYSDIYHNKVQRAIGGNFQFNLEGEIGLRFLLGHRSKCSIDLEAAYRHISDGSLTTRNDGIDSVGGEVGFSVFF